MKQLQKNSVASLIFVVVVVLSILMSGHIKLNHEAQKVLDIFYEGERNDGLSIYSDLDDLTKCTRDIISLTQKVIDPATEELVLLNKAVAAMQSADDPSEYYDAYSAIVDVIDDVSALFVLYCEDDDLALMFEDYAAIFASKMNTIGYDPYNRYVREYEKILNQFPAKLIAELTFVQDVKPFELMDETIYLIFVSYGHVHLSGICLC